MPPKSVRSPEEPGARRRRRLLIRLAVLVLTVPVTLVLCEVGFRLLGPFVGVNAELLEAYKVFVTRGGIGFESRPHTVYARPRSGKSSNSLGFSDEEWTLERRPGVVRIACLGGSTTEGGNPSGRQGTYPFQLEELLEKRTGQEFEVMNCGMSGWSSAETLVAWFLTIQDYDPDLVILHHAVNDVMPRGQAGFQPDYTHWRHAWTGLHFSRFQRLMVATSDLYAWLSMEGDPPNIGDLTTFKPAAPGSWNGSLPKETAQPFRRNIESIGLSVEARGASVLLLTMPTQPLEPDGDPTPVFRYGIAEHNRILRELAEEHGWLLADAERWLAEHPRSAAGAFLDIAHMTAEGNHTKAAIAAKEIVLGWLPSFDPPREGSSD